jgi:N-acyl-D-aspartate/D-glutamate deacylase
MKIGFITLVCLAPLCAQTYDLVILNGRVIDPETRLDAARNIGITAGRIAQVSSSLLTGKTIIDARGLIVSPGFIDLHAHGQDEENQTFQAHDGVTTALELEVGAADVDGWYRSREGKRIINSGVSAGHVPNRMRVMNDPSHSLLPTGPAARTPATAEEVLAMRRRLESGLAAGSVGVGMGIQYTPGATHSEILEMFRAAGTRKAPVFVHIRNMGAGEPQSAMDGLEEVLAGAAVGGTPVHIVHISSSGLKSTPDMLRAIADAHAHGIDVTTECYPYDTAETELQSAMFDTGWQKVLGIDYDGLEWAATGERLTAASFARYRPQGGLVLLHMIPAEVVQLAVASPLTIIASDGLISGGKGHPRTAGSYSRVLGKYVRETNTLTWMEAIRKMSLLPAQRLEAYVPAMKRKGRIQPGADADLTIFDPQTVADRATFQNPTAPSEGIRYVLVNGGTVIQDGRFHSEARFGRAIRAPHPDHKD